ncbi:putative membrane-anchored protein [Oikeobacillus pervagus]|uniref:Membrane-anchored protein n=1 Tax=Oikeobacillus pervagus TaxID=1325931 RepID=A0AAJ1WKA3_9BACI|nr:hypothetical protein [Oikeobacillus pervagus]MDQ0214921.1 putative membrane-anchored protein [Oikeobacillus pervagus]
MNLKLTMKEKQFLNEVLEELKQYQVSSKSRNNIKQQILEHIQEAREHGQDSLHELGDSTTFVKDFLDINGIDLHAKMTKMRKSDKRMGILLLTGSLSFIFTYLASQLILSMFLTESFNPQYTNRSFDYHIFYQISDHTWWNFMLIIISFSTALLVSVLTVKLFVSKIRGW